MNRKVTVLLSVTFVALSVSVFAYTSCRDTTTGCTFDQLVQLNKDAANLGLATSERVAIKQEMVTKLTTEIKQLTSSGSTNGATNTSTATCVDLNNSLVIGSTDATTNGEVSKLQKFIGEYKVKKLYTVAPNNQSGASAEDLQLVSGYYGAKTAANVMEWQKDNGMDYVTPASGVGPTTRGKMRCQAQSEATVKWEIGAKVDDYFNNAMVTLRLPGGVVKTAQVNVRVDCKELNQQNLNDEHIKKVNAVGVFDKESNIVKPGLACVSMHQFSWYGVFFENGKYFVKNLADDASGLGKVKWEIMKEI